MNAASDIEELVAEAGRRKLPHIHLGMFNGHGHLIVKRYHVDHLRAAMTEGVHMVAAILAAAPSGTDMVTSHPLADPDEQFRDGLLRMEASSVRDFPWDANGQGLLLLGEFVDGTSAYCCRAQLRRELERLAESGLEAVAALEMESVALAETAQSLSGKSSTALELRGGYARPYQLLDDPADLAYVDELNATCAAMDVPLDSQHAEFVHLLETSLRPAPGMRAADNAALYKNVAKLLARRHGFTMSFMARWHPEQQGCGAHFNVSLREARGGRPVFFDAAREDHVSDTLRAFVGGLHAYLPELFLLLAPNLNSYKRFAPGLFTPLGNSWGIDNKTVAHRVLAAAPGSARVEVRLAGADVSPHLGLLAVLLAGRLGITERREPPAPVVGNGWGAEATGPAFPQSYEAAIAGFQASPVARDHLGIDFVNAVVGNCHWQLARFQRAVTDWELKMFAAGA